MEKEKGGCKRNCRNKCYDSRESTKCSLHSTHNCQA